MEIEQKKKAVLYCRSAASEQHDTVLARQVQQCRSFAKQQGLQVAKVFAEHGSGIDLQRPKLQKLLRYCCELKSEIDFLIIADWERLSRSPIHLVDLRAFLRQQKMEVLCVHKVDVVD